MTVWDLINKTIEIKEKQNKILELKEKETDNYLQEVYNNELDRLDMQLFEIRDLLEKIKID